MNELSKLDSFKKLLNNYQLSKDSLRILHQTTLVLLVAPTSTGRSRLVHELLKTGDYHYIVSDTTRKPRVNDGVLEQNGVEYWFRREDEVLRDLEKGNYIEAAVVHSRYMYGSRIAEIDKAHQANKIAITDIEIAGVESFMKNKPDTLPIFVLPPSFEEWQRRIKHRGVMAADEFKNRMQSAAQEFAAALEHPYYTFVINDTIEQAVASVHQIAKMGVVDEAQQAEGRKLTEQLYIETQALLRSL